MCEKYCHCKSKLLVAISIVYLLAGVILILVGGTKSNQIDDLPIIPGFWACGGLLVLLAVIGLVGTYITHRNLLLCYMIIIVTTSVIQVGLSAACLAVSEEREQKLVQEGWDNCEGINMQYIWSKISSPYTGLCLNAF